MRMLFGCLLFLTSFFADASNNAVCCDGCTFQQQSYLARASIRPYDEYIFVMDWRAGTLNKYEVIREPGIAPYVIPSAASAAERNEFTAFAGAYRDVAALSREIFIGSDEFDSIYDISRCPACAQRWLTAHQYRLANQLDLMDILITKGRRIGSALGIGGKVQVDLGYDPALQYKVILENDTGPGPAFCMGHLSETEFSIDTSKCTDSDGNRIPVANDGYNYRFSFTQNRNLENWLRLAAELGVQIVVNPTGGVVTVGEPINCAGDPPVCKQDTK